MNYYGEVTNVLSACAYGKSHAAEATCQVNIFFFFLLLFFLSLSFFLDQISLLIFFF